jgi:hypothetical protein
MRCNDAVRQNLTEITLETAALNYYALMKRNFGEKNISMLSALIGMKLQDDVMEVRNKEVQMCKMMSLEGLYWVIGRRKVGQLAYGETNKSKLNLKFNKSLGLF